MPAEAGNKASQGKGEGEAKLLLSQAGVAELKFPTFIFAIQTRGGDANWPPDWQSFILGPKFRNIPSVQGVQH